MNMRTICYCLILATAVIYSNGTVALEPCCGIVSIDLRTGVVTARDTTTRQIVEFKVADVVLLKSLKIGQAIYADYGSQKISVDNLEPCCGITRIRPGQ